MVVDQRVRSAGTAPHGSPSRAQLAIFDLDRTLLPGSSLLPLCRALVAKRLVTRRRLLRAVAQQAAFRRRGATDDEVSRYRDEGLAVVSGLAQATMWSVAGSLGEHLATLATPAARGLLERHVGAGHLCVVLSASPQELVEAVAFRLGAHVGIGTRAEVHNGHYTGALDGPFCYGPGKLTRLRETLGAVDLTEAWAYADSGSDLPLLTACGHPVAVNPDKALLQAATSQGWPVVSLS